MTTFELQAALRRAYHLGQLYWRQADSESRLQQRKSEETAAAFDKLVEETCEALAKAEGSKL